jgi:hypothetical protein
MKYGIGLLIEEKNAFQQYQQDLRMEEDKQCLKSCSLWLKSGDRNTNFFHKQVRAQNWKTMLKNSEG